MKFRKRPIVIEAEQFWPDKKPWPVGVEPPPCRCSELAQDGRICEQCKPNGRKYGIISTLEGLMEVSPGDWVITGVKGERYPCKPDIFNQTYEPVESSNNTIE